MRGKGVPLMHRIRAKRRGCRPLRPVCSVPGFDAAAYNSVTSLASVRRWCGLWRQSCTSNLANLSGPFCMLSTLMLAIALGCSSAASQEKSPDLDVVARLIFEQTNRFRTGEGRSELRPNSQLAATASDLAEFMAKTDKYGHNANGSEPPQRAKKHGYEYCLVAENIAYFARTTGFTSDELAGALVEGWKKSPPHRKNLLDPDALEVGNAVAYSTKSGKYYAVQVL